MTISKETHNIIYYIMKNHFVVRVSVDIIVKIVYRSLWAKKAEVLKRIYENHF